MIDPLQPDYTNTPAAPGRPRFGYMPAEQGTAPCMTVITPFHNTGPVFHETARSVLQQSLQQFEWLIINDGSTDPEALAVLAHYRNGDPRIRIIDFPENRGPAAARNLGFHSARTPYVVQLDSDDLLEPTAAEKWLWFLQSYPEFAFAGSYSVAFSGQEYLWQRGFHDGAASLEENQIDNKTMIRKSAHAAAGGYDETLRQGGEDWDFWLRSATAGYWGGTVPEYLAWYRRRLVHKDWWTHQTEWWQTFRIQLRKRYPQLWDNGFPQVQPRWPTPHARLPESLPCANALQKEKPRLLLILPWLAMGGADKFNLDLLQQLVCLGWEVTIVTTLSGDHSWLPLFTAYTPDIFVLPHFLRAVDYPRFLRYLIESRQIDCVLISQSELGYLLLPDLRAHFPHVTFLDLCHIEDEQWREGGYPRAAVDYQELLDANVVVSEHLKQWMGKRGGDLQRIHTCYINVDSTRWRPDAALRDHVREELQLDPQVPALLYVGRMCEQKQPRVFAHTILHLASSARPFVAIVAGDGPDLAWLRAFVKDHTLDAHVRFLGAVSNDRVRELMNATDILFLPSQWEGIALVIYEAMACGLPVVGADVGGQRELVTLECGILIPRSTEEAEAVAYADTLAKLLEDAALRARMGEAGRNRVEKEFRLEHMGERMVEILCEARRLHTEQPRPTLGRGFGTVCATNAIEYLRVAEVADGLWRDREQPAQRHLSPQLLDPHHDSWRTLAYFAIRQLVLPYYRAGLERRLTWLQPVKEYMKKTLLRSSFASSDDPRPS